LKSLNIVRLTMSRVIREPVFEFKRSKVGEQVRVSVTSMLYIPSGLITKHVSGPLGAIGPVYARLCVCVCVRTMTFELNNL